MIRIWALVLILCTLWLPASGQGETIIGLRLGKELQRYGVDPIEKIVKNFGLNISGKYLDHDIEFSELALMSADFYFEYSQATVSYRISYKFLRGNLTPHFSFLFKNTLHLTRYVDFDDGGGNLLSNQLLFFLGPGVQYRIGWTPVKLSAGVSLPLTEMISLPEYGTRIDWPLGERVGYYVGVILIFKDSD